MKRRRVLKRSGIVIADDLCNGLVNTFNRLKKHPDCSKAWSWDGQLFAELKTGPVVKVRWPESREAPAACLICTQVSLCSDNRVTTRLYDE